MMSLGVSSFAHDMDVGKLRALYQLLTALTRAKSLADVYDSALTSLLASSVADRAAILTFDENGVMCFRMWRGLSEEYRDAVAGHTPWSKGTKNAQPIPVTDVFTDSELIRYQDVLAREGIRSLVFVPIELEDGVYGKFMLYRREPHEWTPEELGIAQLIASHVAVMLERKRAEAARASSEQRLQTILDNSATAIFLKDRQGRYVLVNRHCEGLFHAKQGQIVGKTDYEFFPPEAAARLQENDRKVLAEEVPLTFEESVPDEDGTHTYISVKFPFEDSDGRIAGVCGIATDITERQQFEIWNRHLAAVVEDSYDAILTKDLNGHITSWNKAAERVFGYTAAEAIGRPISLLAPEDRLDEMPMILSRIARGERVDHFETKRKTKDGRTIDVSLTVSPIRDREGRIVGASKISRDITERKRAEQERRLLLAREQEARNTAELLNQVGPRLLAERDPERLVQAITDIATELVGAEFGSFFQKDTEEKGTSYVPSALSGPRQEAFANFPMPQIAEILAPTFRGEGILRCADVTEDARYGEGSAYQVMPKGCLTVRSYLAAPVVSRSGEVIGVLLFGHSMQDEFTERDETLITGIAAQAAITIDNARLFEQGQWAQNELARSNEELRRTNQDLEAFAYSASHDLQEPLRTITLCSELLQRACGDQLGDEAGRFLASILHGGRTMDQLIKDLLAYTTAARSEEGPPPCIDSGHILTEVLQNLKGAIHDVGATVTWGDLPVVSMHEGRLAQLFQNLIGNALKYRSKEAPRVHVSAGERDGWIVFCVQDNGIGIDPAYANQIFELFKRLHNSEQYSGSGLGLAISKRIVEQYGGRIWLDQPEVGGGSKFCFAIPARNQ